MTAVGDARKRAAEAMHDADGWNTGPDAETVPVTDPGLWQQMTEALRQRDAARAEVRALLSDPPAGAATPPTTADLVEQWRDEAEKYAAMGKGRSRSHAQCRQIAHTFTECADQLAALFDAERGEP